MDLGQLVHFVTLNGVHLPAFVVGPAVGEGEAYDLFVIGAPALLSGRACESYPAVPHDEAEKAPMSWHAPEAEQGKKGGASIPEPPFMAEARERERRR